jgi:hypothetical protein
MSSTAGITVADESFPVNNLLATAKSREVQRAMLAEMRGERADGSLHFLAAAHMELVLAVDYDRAGDRDLAFRSRVSAGSCFWRGGRPEQARTLLETLVETHPSQAGEIQRVIAELAHDYPAKAS